MLKNKYLAIVLATIAVIVVGYRIIESLSSENNNPPPKTAPLIKQKEKKASTSVKIKTNKLTSISQKAKNMNTNSFNKRLTYSEEKILNPSSLQWGEDPFGYSKETIEKTKKTIKFEKIKLNAIINDPFSKKAIINNTVFSEGDEKGGIYLQTIEDKYVIVVTKEGKIKLNIFKNRVISIKNKKNSNNGSKNNEE